MNYPLARTLQFKEMSAYKMNIQINIDIGNMCN
jgi:hypothetical protein